MKNSILFVEDNPVLRQAYELVLRAEAGQWEVATAENATSALALIKASPFDVVVSDMRLPDASGVELLKQVRRSCPQTARIIISGISDQEEVARTLGATHQFLPKPVSSKMLKATLSSILSLETQMQDGHLKELVSRCDAIPSFPKLYLEVSAELQKEDPSIDALAAMIARDPGMTAKVLQIVNSAAFGLASRTHDLQEAVQYLGWTAIRSLVLSTEMFSFFEEDRALPQSFYSEIWEHCMKTGALARRLLTLERADPDVVDAACTAGMLHDIGKLMLAHNLPDQFRAVQALAAKEQLPLHEAEMRLLGATHATLAAYVLGLWGLPAPMIEAVAFHHQPGRGQSRELNALAAVHVANSVALEIAGGAAKTGNHLDREYLEAAGLLDRLESWRAQLLSE